MTIIIGAIVSMLVFFFQRWWTAHHPIAPTAEAKAAFINEVNRPRHFWMGGKRHVYAEKLFDKFAANYAAKPQPVDAAPLTEEQAGSLAASLAEGLTLDPDSLEEKDDAGETK